MNMDLKQDTNINDLYELTKQLESESFFKENDIKIHISAKSLSRGKTLAFTLEIYKNIALNQIYELEIFRILKKHNLFYENEYFNLTLIRKDRNYVSCTYHLKDYLYT